MSLHLGDLIVTSPSPHQADPDATVLNVGAVRGVLMRVNGEGTCVVRLRGGTDVSAELPTDKVIVIPDSEFTDRDREWVPLARAVVAETSHASFRLPEADALARFIAANAPGILETQELDETDDGTRRITVWMDREVLGEYALAMPDDGGIMRRYWFGRIPGWSNPHALRANRVLGILRESTRLDDRRFSLVWSDERGPAELDLDDVPAA